MKFDLCGLRAAVWVYAEGKTPYRHHRRRIRRPPGGSKTCQSKPSSDFDRSKHHHLFQPLLYQVAAAYLDPEQIAKPIRGILRWIKGRNPVPFTYKNSGALATIGRNAAVAYIMGRKFRGFTAWAIWLVVHILRLTGFRNRLIVIISWAWDYFLMERAPRLILKISRK